MAFRTQKISQMTPKGANLEATDLIEVSTIESGSYVTRSITGQEIIDAAVGNVDWGDIGGTLSNQTDLQSALDAKVPTSRTLTINGVTQDLSADRTFTISTGITIGSTAIASGVVGRILFEGAGNVVQESSSLFWNATNNRLGIGTSSPAYTFDVNGNIAVNNSVYVYSTAYSSYTRALYDDGSLSTILRGNTHLDFWSANNFRMRVNNSGNVLIGTTTDAGYKLDVNGTARVQGQLNLSTNISATTSSAFGLNYINFNALTANQGISASFSPNGTPGGYAYSFQFAKSSTANNNSLLFIGGGASAGPAGNKHLITTSTDGTATAQPLAFAVATGSWASATALMTLTTTQNVLINTTTDAGFRLDVNGSGRFTGLTITGLATMSAGLTSTSTTVLTGGNTIVRDGTKLLVGGVAGNQTPDASAVLEIRNTTQGFLPPRMTTTQKNAIASPAAGLVVYDTTLNKLCVYTTAWETVTSL